MEQLPEELVVNVCQNMDIPDLQNFIRTSKTHYRICDQILEDKFEEAIDSMIEASKEPTSEKRYSLELGPYIENRIFVLSYHINSRDSKFWITEMLDIVHQFGLKKLGWYRGGKFETLVVTGDETKARLILLDLLSNGYINGKFKTTTIM